MWNVEVKRFSNIYSCFPHLFNYYSRMSSRRLLEKQIVKANQEIESLRAEIRRPARPRQYRGRLCALTPGDVQRL